MSWAQRRLHGTGERFRSRIANLGLGAKRDLLPMVWARPWELKSMFIVLRGGPARPWR